MTTVRAHGEDIIVADARAWARDGCFECRKALIASELAW